MDISFIILAHKDPTQLLRLVSKLESANSFFYIHIDRNSKIQDFKRVLKDKDNVIYLGEASRESGVWGGFGIVKATINGLRKVIEDERKGHVYLLSGQDYPLQPLNFIQKFLRKHQSTDFITTWKMPAPHWQNGGYYRLQKYRINKTDNRGDYVLLSSLFDSSFYTKDNLKVIYTLIRLKKYRDIKLIFNRRNFSSIIPPYGGHQWFCFCALTAQKILSFIDENPMFTKFHQYTLLSDEFFFQSIIMHLKKKDQSILLKPTLTYTNWNKKGVNLPVTFKTHDFPELKIAAQNHLFARKFNEKMDNEILSLIDQKLL